MNIEKAAQKLAECMDYPWEFMPEQGRENMRNHVKAIFEAANSAPAEDVRAAVDEPVAEYQVRTRSSDREGDEGWCPWERCSEFSYADYVRVPVLHGWEYQTRKLYSHPQRPVVMPEKYDDVLLPFLVLMRAELHANAHKGDRPGWLSMDRKTAVLEVFYHMGKLHQAVHRDEAAAIREYAADVANMCMMLTDVCGCLDEFARLNPEVGK